MRLSPRTWPGPSCAAVPCSPFLLVEYVLGSPVDAKCCLLLPVPVVDVVDVVDESAAAAAQLALLPAPTAFEVVMLMS